MESRGAEDLELAAMAQVRDALQSLQDDAARGRVLRWAQERFRMTAAAPMRSGPSVQPESHDGEAQEFADLATFFAAASPSTDAEKVLCVGYWLQVHEGQEDLDGFRVNDELKNLGYGVSNVTRAFDSLQIARPQLALQTRKAGTSKQARKKYRLTVQGVRRAEQMTRQQESEAESE